VILAGDIGGTNTRLALFDGDPREPVALSIVPSRSVSGLEEAVNRFLADHSSKLRAAAFGVAGPIQDGRAVGVNLPWEVDAASVADTLGLDRVRLLNDLEANATGLSALGPEDLALLCPGTADPVGNQVVISAGTGLGQAIVSRRGGHVHVLPGEGGHVDFAPTDELQIDLWRFLAGRYDHVSIERLLSGTGLTNIYAFLVETQGADPLPAEPSPADVSASGLDGSSPTCARVLELFAAIYGQAAGNTALTVMATGGVFLGGGIAPRLLPVLGDGTFQTAFRSKGRFAPVLEQIPVHIVLNDKTALIGAGLAAATAAEGGLP
jgi:glucokinase